MTKKLKNIFISLFGVLAFLFAGVFFVGCGVDYKKISLSADVASINLQVGEEKDVTFTINGYQKGFNNQIQIDKQSNGLSSVFSVGQPTYISNNTIRITVRGVAGGNGTLTIRTLEAGKECSVDVQVEETANSMLQRNSVLYVSNKTAFKPSADLFEFPANTTNKKLSFYYISGDKPSVDLNTYRLQLDGSVITFANGQETVQRTVVPFDEIRLLEQDDQEKLVAVFNGQQTELELKQNFLFAAIYTQSLISEDYPSPMFVVSQVQVLKDIKLNISGGYLQQDNSVTQANEENAQKLNFKPVTGQKIIIVPNNPQRLQYVLKVEAESFEGVDINIKKSNENVIVDFISGDIFGDASPNVKYLKISQNSMKQAFTSVEMSVYYNTTKDVQDESVNRIEQFEIETEIAPKYITVNGSLEPQKLVMYNQYTSPEYGWRDLDIQVISEFDGAPTFKGVYFEYNSDYIEMLYNGSPVVQGEGMLYSNLDTPFQVRGKLTAAPVENEEIKIVLLSDILSDGKDKIEITVPYQIKAGATIINVDTPYQDYRYFYLDADWKGEFKPFNRQLYANHEFQSITVKYISGMDVVEFNTNPNNPCNPDSEREGFYWLNLALNVRSTGIGIYDIILDNGITRRVSFNVIDTLKPSSTEIKMSNEGNQNVKEYSFGKYYTTDQDPGFNNHLQIQILNPSTRDSISFGNTASFEITANVSSDAITYELNNALVSVSQIGNRFNVTTLANGVTQIMFTLKGNIVDEALFKPQAVDPNISILVEITSYSLVDEFYLKNGDSLALSNIVYYGSANDNESSKLTFTPVANNGLSSNFQQYAFDEVELVRLFGLIENGSMEGVGNEEERDDAGHIKQDANGNTIYKRYRYDVTSSAFSKLVKSVYVPEESYVEDGQQVGDKFISFTVLNENGGTLDETVTDVTITKDDGATRIERTIRLFFFNSLMFRGQDMSVQANGATYRIHFSNVYEFVYGSFDTNTFTYTHTYPSATRPFVLSANLRQRDNSKRYDARIVAQRYNEVTSISLLSGTTYIDFDKDTLTAKVGVFTYPVDATNSKIHIEFVPTNGNPYSDMVTFPDDDELVAQNGIYMITISCEQFYESEKDLWEIQDSLTGDLYIYPEEWGTSYTSLTEGRTPIKISLQYRNGSRANPYLLEDSDDVANINKDVGSLSSHYEIRSIISMGAKKISPIGIIGGTVEGFSGSITGTTSQAKIIDVNISDLTYVDGKQYAGLFAQINAGAVIENVTISGSVKIERSAEIADAYVGLLAAINKGSIINAGARFTDASNISATVYNLYFGGLAAINYGTIQQDFTKYDGTGYTFKKYTENIQSDDLLGHFVLDNGNVVRVDEEGYAIDENGKRIKFDETGKQLSPLHNFEGMTPINLAFFENGCTLTIDASNKNVYAGGIVGANGGLVERLSPQDANYRMYGYTAYSAYTRIDIVGQFEGTVTNKIAVGGAVGVATYYKAGASGDEISLPLPDVTNMNNAIKNLLVGGKIDALSIIPSVHEGSAQRFYDYIGGVIGYVSTLNEKTVNILQNTSRTFVRGNFYVGGLVGFDHNPGSEYNVLSTFGEGEEKNKYDAVDDGEASFYAASIIRTQPLVIEAGKSVGDVIYMIGNSHNNIRGYAGDLFEVSSYLSRSKIEKTDNILPTVGTKTDYYGNWLVAERAGKAYNITDKQFFNQKSVILAMEDTDYAMQPENEDERFKNTVFYTNYFHVDTDLRGAIGSAAQEQIEALNHLSPTVTPQLYPFRLKGNSEASLVATTSNVLEVDVNGNMTIKKSGIAEIKLSSVLNENVTQTIYIFVVNYFDKNIQASLFYATRDYNGVNLSENSRLTIYGDTYTNLYLLPSYNLQDVTTQEGDSFSISREGVLTYKNVAYRLSQNSELTTDVTPDKEDEDIFSSAQVSKQTIVFNKQSATAKEADIDKYTLVPVLRTTIYINGKEYVFYKVLENSTLNLDVIYHEKATSISTTYDKYSIETNEAFSDIIRIESTNPEEYVFYQIVGQDGIVQRKIPKQVGSYGKDASGELISYEDYINDCQDDLFNITFERVGKNNFKFNCSINTNSDAYQNRFNKSIAGDYTFMFFASELLSGVSHSFILKLSDAKLNYVGVNNYSNINDVSVSDEIIEPGRTGLLEISLNPIEAVFETFTISNNAKNSALGSGLANFIFAYEKVTGEGVTYETISDFGTFENGISFTYKELTDLYARLSAEMLKDNVFVSYKGKIYISYYLVANNVEDGTPVAFDITIERTQNDPDPLVTTKELYIKIGSYAKLVFENKEMIGDGYYVARGLSYNMTLDMFGFTESDISFSIESNFISLTGSNGKYVLTISPDSTGYEGTGGYEVTIVTVAQKIVDNQTVHVESQTKLYIMEFVFNYNYNEGVNADIVRSMHNGVINIAVGEPIALELAINAYLEYNPNIASVVEKVSTFVSSMTASVTWRAYILDESINIERGKVIRDNSYFYADGLVVTPIRVYDYTTDVYHFSVDGRYVIRDGYYQYATAATQFANRIYTEFCFDVHNQSTHDSPIPVENYDDLIGMEEGQWYILLDNIEIPNYTYTQAHQLENFAPLNTAIAGLDGNNYQIIFSGEYVFDSTNVGLFGTVNEQTILQNISIRISEQVRFRVEVADYRLGVLAAINNGKITNAQVENYQNAGLTVIATAASTEAYVAGLVGENNGFITNSRSSVDISASVNLAGFVGVNSGHIASSYYRGASLTNTTRTTQEFTAGFVINNSGDIYTSYASGDLADDNLSNQDSLFYNGTANSITSGTNITGFVYSNSGNVKDCYSNIRLSQSGGSAAGFVYENSGLVERSFSTSVLQSRQTTSYGFAMQNSVTVVEQQGNGTVSTIQGGTINDCFYLSHARTDMADRYGDVNVSIESIDTDEKAHISVLDIADFANMDNFNNFVVAEGRDMNSVWFFNNDRGQMDNFNGNFFNVGRIELVAPNIKATSRRNLFGMEEVVDPVTQAQYTRYIYTYDANYPALGAAYNPIVISSAEEMENYILQENDHDDTNFANYRLIADIDYSEYYQNSQIYSTRFMGSLEGNFMSISGNSVLSNQQRNYSGLFAEVGGAYDDAVGTVMNFTYSPTIVTFSNTSVVGAIAGKVENGNILNIDLKASTGGSRIIVGTNITGGAVGMMIGNSKLQNVHSEFGAQARNQSPEDGNQFEISFGDMTNQLTKYSFAGSIVGVVSGNSRVLNCQTETAISVLADKAGLMFGFVDEEVTVSTTTLQMQADMVLNGYSYAGLVVGETKGMFKDVQILPMEGSFTNFRALPSVAEAVGGFAGIISDGEIENISMEQNFTLSSESSSKGFKDIGGIAGIITGGATLKNVHVNSSIVGMANIGAVVGEISTDNQTVTFTDLDVHASLTALGSQIDQVNIGGFVGQISPGAKVVLSTSHSADVERLQGLYSNKTSLEERVKELETQQQAADDRIGDLEAENTDLQTEIDNGSYTEGHDKEKNEAQIKANNDIISTLNERKSQFDAQLIDIRASLQEVNTEIQVFDEQLKQELGVSAYDGKSKSEIANYILEYYQNMTQRVSDLSSQKAELERQIAAPEPQDKGELQAQLNQVTEDLANANYQLSCWKANVLQLDPTLTVDDAETQEIDVEKLAQAIIANNQNVLEFIQQLSAGKNIFEVEINTQLYTSSTQVDLNISAVIGKTYSNSVTVEDVYSYLTGQSTVIDNGIATYTAHSFNCAVLASEEDGTLYLDNTAMEMQSGKDTVNFSAINVSNKACTRCYAYCNFFSTVYLDATNISSSAKQQCALALYGDLCIQ